MTLRLLIVSLHSIYCVCLLWMHYYSRQPFGQSSSWDSGLAITGISARDTVIEKSRQNVRKTVENHREGGEK